MTLPLVVGPLYMLITVAIVAVLFLKKKHERTRSHNHTRRLGRCSRFSAVGIPGYDNLPTSGTVRNR